MEREYFEWGKYSGENGGLIFPVDAMEDIFLINTKKDEVWLSKKCASLLSDGRAEIEPIITQKEFQTYFSESGGYAFKQAVLRLESRQVERVGCHASVQGRTRELSAVVYLYRLSGREELFGHISVDYEPMREYEEHLEQVIKQLKHVQMVNELTVEGASDYVYQLDFVNNVCTFSSKASSFNKNVGCF